MSCLTAPGMQSPRSLMVAGFNSDPPLPLPPTLTLSTLLVASPPPPPIRQIPTSLDFSTLTSTFFGAVAALRVASGLPHLDTG